MARRQKQAENGRQTKAERRQARTELIESRLARIEEAVDGQAQRSEELLAKLAEANDARIARKPSPATVLGGSLDGEAAENLERELRLRRENVVAVDQPLALICQAQRSGGTLLGRLFDGHPECHAHPHELHIGERRPHTWPELALDDEPAAWFARLKEEKLGLLFNKGRRRIPLKTGVNSDEDYYPFMLPPGLQRQIFFDEVERRSPIGSEREILNAYMTSLFNAWLDNQNLRGSQKRWVVAFSPRRTWGEGLKRYVDLYPDGRLISILRDPLSWYTSAQGRDPKADMGGLLELWKRSAEEMVAAKRSYEERVRIVRFDELVLDTPATMRLLAEFLGIDFEQRLTTPTFNGYPVGANSSYGEDRVGVVSDPVERYKELLSDEQQKLITAECQDLYDEALALTERRTAPKASKPPASRPKRAASKREPATSRSKTSQPKPAAARGKG
jgi:hypothetical protein